MEKNKELRVFAEEIRVETLKELANLGFGHVGGSMSVVELLAVLYGKEMRIDPSNPQWENRDKLVMSKGHAGPAVYATLALKGYFPKEDLLTLNQGGTNFPSHCDRLKTTGVDMTTGSLGQGTSLAAGLALGDRLAGRDSRVFLIVGDGELNEGQAWEAAMFTAAKKLTNLTWIIDANKRQLDGWTEEIYDMGDFTAKMEAFGFDTVTIDGNNLEELVAALERTRKGGDKPYAIVMNTLKGCGVPDVANTKMNHSMSVSAANYEKRTAELDAQLAALEG